MLTSCVLRYKPQLVSRPGTPGVALPSSFKRKQDSESEAGAGGEKGRVKSEGGDAPNEEGFVNCCFSFTIRRDKWGIPSMIVGNFIKC